MFRRKPNEGEDKILPEPSDDLGIPKPGVRPAATTTAPAKPAPTPLRPATPAPEATRPAEVPRTPRMSEAPRRAEVETRKLIVGREISLSGEITQCDKLVVEGSVEANLVGCRDVDIAESGLFKGSASIDDAEIRGRFEGVLTVRKRLFIRSTGKVVGTIRYGQIEIECGGQISGDVQAQGMSEGESSRPSFGAPSSFLEAKAS
jgi:cytoskeletal protein CcmA (bactofilin family)